MTPVPFDDGAVAAFAFARPLIVNVTGDAEGTSGGTSHLDFFGTAAGTGTGAGVG